MSYFLANNRSISGQLSELRDAWRSIERADIVTEIWYKKCLRTRQSCMGRQRGRREGASVTPPTVFISYSHRDEMWKDRLLTQLGVLQQQSILALWHDHRIGAGADWYQEIRQAMEAAHVAVLLISADFLTSSFILREEVARLMDPAAAGRPPHRAHPPQALSLEAVPWLARMQLRPLDARPLSAGNEHQIETELTAIAEEIAALIRRATPETTVVNVQEIEATPAAVEVSARPVGTGQRRADQPVRYSGQTKIAICSRLLADWSQLADYLDVPSA